MQLGVMAPHMQPAECLSTGQVGYIVTGLKSTKSVRVGDTWYHHKTQNVDPLPGFEAAKANMFAGVLVASNCSPHVQHLPSGQTELPRTSGCTAVLGRQIFTLPLQAFPVQHALPDAPWHSACTLKFDRTDSRTLVALLLDIAFVIVRQIAAIQYAPAPAGACIFPQHVRGAGIYPMSQEGFSKLSDAVDKLTLNDASVSVRKETSVALGPGFRCGFLGMLHMDVFMQRLLDEHGSEVRFRSRSRGPVMRLQIPSIARAICKLSVLQQHGCAGSVADGTDNLRQIVPASGSPTFAALCVMQSCP
jgi:hypothetical protein